MTKHFLDHGLRYGRVLGIVACAVGVPFVFPGFLVFQISLSLTYAIAILGLNLLLGFNGQISMAQGVFFALGGYTSAILISRYHVPYLATLPAAAGISALVGSLVGVPALRLQGLQLAITTLGLAAIVPPLALKLDTITNGVNGIMIDRPMPPAWFPGDQDSWLYAVCVLGAAACVLVMRRLLRGDSGRVLRAVRDNSMIAESQGVNVTIVRLSAFTVSASFAGFGGGLFAVLNGFVSPDSFQITKSFDFLVGAIVGGITSIAGAFVGALFVVFVPDWSADIHRAMAGIIYSIALIALMLSAREGIVGLVRSLAMRLVKRAALGVPHLAGEAGGSQRARQSET